MFEADITKVVEEMSVHIRETQEDFILDTIFPYCQETLQRKINKAELKQIILRGSRPKGKWIEIEIDAGEFIYKCTKCGMRVINPYKYCPMCGSCNGGGEDESK